MTTTEPGKQHELGWTLVHPGGTAMIELFGAVRCDVTSELLDAHMTHLDVYTDKGVYRIHTNGKVEKKQQPASPGCSASGCTDPRHPYQWCLRHLSLTPIKPQDAP